MEIKDNGDLVIRAPYKTKKGYIEELVLRNRLWIEKKRKEVLNRIRSRPPFCQREALPFLGRDYPLVFNSMSKGVYLSNDKGFILPKIRCDELYDCVKKWYIEQARELFYFRCRYYMIKFNARFFFRISNAKTLWGSCSSKSVISLVWRLVMAPLDVIDYVIAHEIAHLRYKSHSKLFWKRLESIYPNYREMDRWLRDKGGGLYL